MSSASPSHLHRRTSAPLSAPEHLPLEFEAGRLLELSADSSSRGSARTTTAVRLLHRAQLEGETTAWIQPAFGPLFPPDLEQCGIDIEALVVIQVPRAPNGSVVPHRSCKAAELLLRSGAFGFVVLDLTEGIPTGGDAWQGRLVGLSRQHHSRLVLLTEKPSESDSLGPLIGLRVEPQRSRESTGKFVVQHHVLKNKSGTPCAFVEDHYRGPWGLS